MARPRKPLETDVFIAIETGVLNVHGEEILVRRGVTRVHRGSEVYREFPTFFKPIDVHYPAVEQMTAAPGELRGA